MNTVARRTKKHQQPTNVIPFPNMAPFIVGYCEPVKEIDLHELLLAGITDPVVLGDSTTGGFLVIDRDTQGEDAIHWHILPERFFED